MTRQTIILVFAFLFTTSFAVQQKDNLYLNYVAAIKNESTFQYFLVVKAKNLNTGLTREYCTKGDFLKGALHREYKLGYGDKAVTRVSTLAVSNKGRYFEFKNEGAIWNIGGVWNYSMDDLAKLEKKINFDSLAAQIHETGKWSQEISDDRTMLMYAHALFNRGILTGEHSCLGGTLIYIDRNKMKD